jgi:hypothetical protein
VLRRIDVRGGRRGIVDGRVEVFGVVGADALWWWWSQLVWKEI